MIPATPNCADCEEAALLVVLAAVVEEVLEPLEDPADLAVVEPLEEAAVVGDPLLAVLPDEEPVVEPDPALPDAD